MSSKAIFTSAPLARQQLTSDIFSQKGNAGEAPCSVSETRITAITSYFKSGIHAVLAHLWVYVMAFLMDETYDNDTPSKPRNVVKFTQTIRELFPYPTITVTFPQGTKSEERDAKMTDLGFSKGSLQRYVFYKGKADKKTIGELVTMGASADCHAPPGTSNIKGFACLDILNRVLHAALGYLSNWDSDTVIEVVKPEADDDDKEEYRTFSQESWQEYAITSAAGAVQGHIFPYFDGLCLPDKSLTPRVFVRLFSNLFGSTGAETASGLQTFLEGWNSLANTPSGLAISHLFFGIDLVMSVPGIRLRPIFLNDVYRGFALQGSCAVFKGHVKYLPISKEDMATEISNMDRHKVALVEIAQILSSLALEKTKEKESILVEHLTSQRAIHNYMRARAIPNDVAKTLSVAINKTEFREDYWDVTDKGKIARAISLIVGSEWPGDDVPFALKSNAMFTHERVYSILAAFGLRAPSILGVGNNISFPITQKGKFYEELKGVSLPGVPIFYKNLQNAYEDWCEVLKNRNIYFKHGGNDKHGVGRITALGCWVPKDSPSGKQIINNLSSLARVEKRKEREGETDQGKNRDKRIRRTVADKDSVLALMAFDESMPSGEPSSSAVEMEVDEF